MMSLMIIAIYTVRLLLYIYYTIYSTVQMLCEDYTRYCIYISILFSIFGIVLERQRPRMHAKKVYYRCNYYRKWGVALILL
jgi:hypothetical protein